MRETEGANKNIHTHTEMRNQGKRKEREGGREGEREREELQKRQEMEEGTKRGRDSDKQTGPQTDRNPNDQETTTDPLAFKGAGRALRQVNQRAC